MTTRICVDPTYKTPEPANAGEVATSQPSTGMAPSCLRTFRDSLVAWITATVHAAGALLRDFFGPVELTIGPWCSICDDVHEVNTRCPRQLIGVCLDCNRWRTLNRYGMCPSGHRSIVQRRLRWPDATRGNPATK